ncbi:cell division protein FtsZ [Helicobacter fennelliae]|uniref:Cell division protein FtsZ n=2 Tax=Helicobacter fennelliae TaxID=215 RepID=T1CRP7_9HELI|nr:cell division protein FtsZ [Helicobacter fennelliae]GAD19419.1 cell division protein FtsZ [Helicobacter fennelliae MRY12-0050]SQB99234.1 cell division protein FtsZ [Helicobacter fennelliae]STP08454.1 cell division protein FtsZ [Helicobacter fennelliae]
MAQDVNIEIQEVKTTKGAKIAVVGVGGGGSNMVAYLSSKGIHQDVTLIATNTDIQHLGSSPAQIKIPLGEKTTNGLGAGMNPEVGRKAAQESVEEIRRALGGADIVIVSAGLGGGTGTGAAPVIAETAKEMGALTISIATKPFKFEGSKRTKLAESGLEELKKASDSIIVIPNEKLLSISSKTAGIKDCFAQVDDVLCRAVNGISGVILNHGSTDINVDFADLKKIIDYKGLALMGTGEASGENAAIDAIRMAIESPLFDNLSINGAMGVVINFELHPNYPLIQITEAMTLVSDAADDNAEIIWGTQTNADRPEDSVKVTIIATGFEKDIIENNKSHAQQEKAQKEAPSTLFTDANFESFRRVSGSDDLFEIDLEKPSYLRHKKD